MCKPTENAMSRHIAIAFAAVAVATILVTGAGAGSTSAPGQQAPVNLTPPSISGTTQAGSSLTAALGAWDGRSLKYAYQWLRCDSGGASCSAIGGATSSTTSLSSADLSATLRVVVTATNRNGSAAATSAATAAIASAPAVQPPLPPPPPTITSPSVTSPPTITGTSQQGQTLTTSTGSWSGTFPMTYSYLWWRCDSAGASCASIAGTTANYLLASADVGATIRASVTASNSAGSATASSAATAAITASSCAPTDPTTDRLYSCSSTFNEPIPANAPIHPDSAKMMSQDVWVKGYDSNTIMRPWLGMWAHYSAVAHATTSTPFVNVQINNASIGGCAARTVTAPIPSGTVVRMSGIENNLVVYHPDGREWQFYSIAPPGVANPFGSLRCPTNGNWQANSWSVDNPLATQGWKSVGYFGTGARASKINYGAGVVQPRDLHTGTGDYGHALAIRSWRTCASGQAHPRYVAPATGGGGTYANVNCIPEGARVQLDPSFDANGSAYVVRHPWAGDYLRTLQRYGAIIVDEGAQVDNWNYETGLPGWTNWAATYPWAGAGEYNIGCFTAGCDQSASIAVPNDLMAKFRVIDWNKYQ